MVIVRTCPDVQPAQTLWKTDSGIKRRLTE